MSPSRQAPPRLRAAAWVLCGLLAAPQLCAQEWPARPLRLVAPFVAGVHPDIVARALAQELTRRLGQPVVVENRPGAQSNIGFEAAARAAPDGYTFLFALTGLVINPHIQRVGFDPVRDFAAVAPISRTQLVLVASPALPVANVDELVEYARHQPGRVSCAHSGGATQLGCALFATLARVTLLQVPYRGNTLIYSDLARGEVHMMFDALGALPNVQAVQGKALALTSSMRGGEPPGSLPSLSEKLPGFEIASWQGVVAPAGTPMPILYRMNAEIAAAIGSPDLARQLALGGARPMHATPEEFGEFLRREHARYGRIVQDAGLRAE